MFNNVQIADLIFCLRSAAKGYPISQTWFVKGSDRGDGFPVGFRFTARDGVITAGVVHLSSGSVMYTAPAIAEEMRKARRANEYYLDHKRGWYA